jgi:hypothetical protein
VKRIFLFGILVLFFCALCRVGLALTAEEILDEMEARRTSFVTQRVLGKIILVDASGKEEVREMIMYSKDEGDDKTSVIFRFLSPAEVKKEREIHGYRFQL